MLKYNCNPLLARVQPSCLQWQNQNQFYTSWTIIIRKALGKEEDTQYAWGRWKVMTRIKRGMLKIQNRNPVIKIYLFNKSWLLFVLELIQFLLMSMCSSLAMSPCIFFNLTLFRILRGTDRSESWRNYECISIFFKYSYQGHCLGTKFSPLSQSSQLKKNLFLLSSHSNSGLCTTYPSLNTMQKQEHCKCSLFLWSSCLFSWVVMMHINWCYNCTIHRFWPSPFLGIWCLVFCVVCCREFSAKHLSKPEELNSDQKLMFMCSYQSFWGEGPIWGLWPVVSSLDLALLPSYSEQFPLSGLSLSSHAVLKSRELYRRH